MNKYFPLFYQFMRFGVIGLTAAVIHFSVVVLLVELGWMTPLVANVFAFLTAFQCSYWGNRYWTFRDSTVMHRVAMRRLFFLYIVNFILNQSLYALFLTVFHWPYMLALFIVLSVLPLITFTVGRCWVFR